MEQLKVWGTIPDKLYFRIGEVCRITGVKQHVLRYWESEFKVIRPQRAASKQRLYRKVDVENILKIQRMLHDEGYTIAGAKRVLAKPRKPAKGKVKTDALDQVSLVKQMKMELLALQKMLAE